MKEIPIVAFKLTTGEIGIGKLNEKEKKIEKALLVAFKVDEKTPAKPQITLILPLAPLSNEFPSISLNHVLFYEYVTNEQIKSLYLQITTGLTIPKIEMPKNVANIIDFNKFAKK